MPMKPTLILDERAIGVLLLPPTLLQLLLGLVLGVIIQQGADVGYAE
jgi:hypothetical protein